MKNMSKYGRRSFLSRLGLTLSGLFFGSDLIRSPRRILLRSSWQTINIGDIAHTPGVLRLVEKFLPDTKMYLWPSSVDNGIDRLLEDRFPGLIIADNPLKLKEAFAECDFLLHGSGASLVAEKDVKTWVHETGKPFGVYGITLPPKKSHQTEPVPLSVLKETIKVLSKARFVFFRDSKSLTFAKKMGCTCPIMEFGPDGAFACDLTDDSRALSFLHKHDLEPQNFVCCIPRLRYTPSWVIPSKNRSFDPVKHARNEEMKEHDHAPLRKAIQEVVHQTNLKVLICPEDQTQMQVGKELLYDPLPESVRPRVVWRSQYWLTGEAISTYMLSLGLFGNEMHSPIMCIGQGVPAIVCRWEEQTTKGYMWEDIGLGDWLFNLDDEEQVRKIVPGVLAMAQQPGQFKRKAAEAREFVRKRQKETMGILQRQLYK